MPLELEAAPGVRALRLAIDKIGAKRDKLLDRVEDLREQKKALDLDLKRINAETDELEEYLLKHVTRLRARDCEDLKGFSVVGDSYRAYTGEARPKFRITCEAAYLPEELRKVTYALKDAAALAAHESGTLPDCVEAIPSPFIRIERV